MSIRRPLLVLLLLTPATAQAADLYVGLGLGSGVDATTLDSSAVDPVSSGDRYKIVVGLNFLKFFGVEAAYYDFGDQGCCEQVADFGFATGTNAYALAVVGRLPVGPRLTLLGKVGTMAWDESGTILSLLGPGEFSDSGTDLLAGIGLGIRLPFGFEVRGEWERYELGGHSTHGVWGTLLYRF